MDDRIGLLLGTFLMAEFIMNLRMMDRSSGALPWLGNAVVFVLAVGLILNSYGVMPA